MFPHVVTQCQESTAMKRPLHEPPPPLPPPTPMSGSTDAQPQERVRTLGKTRQALKITSQDAVPGIANNRERPLVTCHERRNQDIMTDLYPIP